MKSKPAPLATLAACVALLSLTACGDEAAEPAATETGSSAGAQGEVLGGTISDDMLPLDTVRSQSPPIAGEDGSDDENGSGNGSENDAAAEDDADGDAAE